jgi:hypothetical protein
MVYTSRCPYPCTTRSKASLLHLPLQAAAHTLCHQIHVPVQPKRERGRSNRRRGSPPSAQTKTGRVEGQSLVSHHARRRKARDGSRWEMRLAARGLSSSSVPERMTSTLGRETSGRRRSRGTGRRRKSGGNWEGDGTSSDGAAPVVRAREGGRERWRRWGGGRAAREWGRRRRERRKEEADTRARGDWARVSPGSPFIRRGERRSDGRDSL